MWFLQSTTFTKPPWLEHLMPHCRIDDNNRCQCSFQCCSLYSSGWAIFHLTSLVLQSQRLQHMYHTQSSAGSSCGYTPSRDYNQNYVVSHKHWICFCGCTITTTRICPAPGLWRRYWLSGYTRWLVDWEAATRLNLSGLRAALCTELAHHKRALPLIGRYVFPTYRGMFWP